MTDRVITADASQMSGADFFAAVTGRPRIKRDRAAEAAYLDAVNAHWEAAKAESDAIERREGEDAIDHLRRKLAPLYAHDEWRREQARLWAAGRWVAPEQARRAA